MSLGDSRRTLARDIRQILAAASQTREGIEKVSSWAAPVLLHHRRARGLYVDLHQVRLRHAPHDAVGESEEACGRSPHEIANGCLVHRVMAEHED
jgi:hypothetical protein